MRVCIPALWSAISLTEKKFVSMFLSFFNPSLSLQFSLTRFPPATLALPLSLSPSSILAFLHFFNSLPLVQACLLFSLALILSLISPPHALFRSPSLFLSFSLFLNFLLLYLPRSTSPSNLLLFLPRFLSSPVLPLSFTSLSFSRRRSLSPSLFPPSVSSLSFLPSSPFY